MKSGNQPQKKALITGAGTRLGYEYARYFIDRQVGVAVHYHSSAAGALTLKEYGARRGVPVELFQVDLADLEAVALMIQDISTHFGELDYLINNASIFEHKDLWQTDLATWSRTMNINLTAPFLLAQEFARRRRDRSGVIINILDWRVARTDPNHFAYIIAKSGLAALTTNLARVLAPSIRVNGLALGAVLPPTDSPVSPTLIKQVPLARWATVAEVCQALWFLVHEASYITGTILQVDGGRLTV